MGLSPMDPITGQIILRAGEVVGRIEALGALKLAAGSPPLVRASHKWLDPDLHLSPSELAEPAQSGSFVAQKPGDISSGTETWTSRTA